MRLLFTIPHYFHPTGAKNPDGRPHGSTELDAAPRVQALTACITGLHQHFGRPQCVIDFVKKTTVPAAQSTTHEVHVVVCTTQGRHVLNELALPKQYYEHRPTRVEPMLLGFTCHEALHERLGDFDYYCYLEDDLVLHDPWFFLKLDWFGRCVSEEHLLQPHRYEVGVGKVVQKAYIDGPLPKRTLARYRPDLKAAPRLRSQVMELAMAFELAANPHSGCFFLNARQMRLWSKQPHFLDRDTSFVGPLESAATLGMVKTFRVYKPALDHASFFEIEHFGSEFLNMIRTK